MELVEQAWAGIDAGKGHHHVVVIDGEGRRLLSRRLINDEPDIVAAIGDVHLAAAMDARTARIGDPATRHALPWAVSALGLLPASPLGRRQWQQRAAAIGNWRELSVYDNPRRPDRPPARRDCPDNKQPGTPPRQPSMHQAHMTSVHCPPRSSVTSAARRRPHRL